MTEVTYYYDANDGSNYWTNETYATDNNLATFATSPNFMADYLTLPGTTCDGTNLGTITKVEARVYGYKPAGVTLYFFTLNNAYSADNGASAGWSSYIDATADHAWTWATIQAGDQYGSGGAYREGGSGTAGVAKIELRVTYTESGGGTVIPVLMHQYRQRRS